MVSNYKRKTERGSYSKDKLKEAAQAVKNGSLSGYKASQLYKIPRMTIMDCVNNRRTKSNTLGRNTALTPEAEARLANGLKLMEKYGFGLTRKEVLQTVGEYVEKNNISTNFKNGIPGQAWFASFKNRYNMSIKKPQAVEYARKKAIDPFIVYPYFDLLKNTLEELNLTEKPEAIWNMDETSFSRDPENTKIVGAKGHAATRVISSPGRDNTTVLLCANALGEKAPPMIVYKGKNVWDSWVSPDAYPNTSYAATANGWMESEIFEQYFTKTFLPAIGNQRPVLLIYDGHATHVGLNIILKAREAGVTILKLPAHTSHILQPLDVSLMKSFKVRWDELLVKWQRLNVGVALPKAEFARLIGEVWKQIDGQILKKGFRKAGIFPHNVDEIAERNFDSLKLQRWRHHLATMASENSDKIVAKIHTPKSLMSLALVCIMRETSVASVECDSSDRNVNTWRKQENLSFELNDVSAKITEKTTPKIQILENKIVSFEDLLLLKVKAGNIETVKRRKMAPGAEVITHEDVLRHKIENQAKNIKKEPQTKKEKGIGKKTRDSEKENIEKAKKEKEEKNNKKTKNNSKRKAKKLPSKKNIRKFSETTSESDIMSVHSDSDLDDACLSNSETEIVQDYEIIQGGNKKNKLKQENSSKICTQIIVHSEPKRMPHKTLKIAEDKKQCESKTGEDAVEIDTKIDKTNKNHDYHIRDKKYNIKQEKSTKSFAQVDIHYESKLIPHKTRKQTVKSTSTKDIDINTKSAESYPNKTKEENSNNTETKIEGVINMGKKYDGNGSEEKLILEENDTILVRYYEKKSWKYYVGVVQNIENGDRFKVSYYKHSRDSKKFLKLVMPKKRDIDIVPVSEIVKKIELMQINEDPCVFVLLNDEDDVYF